MLLTKRMAALSALSAAALIGSAAMGALPASASTVVPATAGATQCSGDLCIQNISPSGSSNSTIRAWADTTTFTGHFELTFSDGVAKNSPTETWHHGGAGFKFTGIPVGDGYRMTAWKGTSKTGFKDIGDVGFLVG